MTGATGLISHIYELRSFGTVVVGVDSSLPVACARLDGFFSSVSFAALICCCGAVLAGMSNQLQKFCSSL